MNNPIIYINRSYPLHIPKEYTNPIFFWSPTYITKYPHYILKSPQTIDMRCLHQLNSYFDA